MKEGNSRITLNLKSLTKIVGKGCRIKKLKQDEWMMEEVVILKIQTTWKNEVANNFKLIKLK